LGLFLGSIGDDDAAGGFRLGIDTGKHDPIVKRAEFHEDPPISLIQSVIAMGNTANSATF
jgi:hypothetical protein